MPIVVVSERAVQDGKLDSLDPAFKAAAAAMQGYAPGLKAIFYFVDKENPLMVHDIQWFKDQAAFLGHIDKVMGDEDAKGKLMNWFSNYDMGPGRPGLTGSIFGDWNDDVVNRTQGMGAQFKTRTSLNGFIKTTGEGLKGPPTIVVSRRWVKEGQLEAATAAMQEVTDWYKENVPGVLAITHCQDDEDPLMVHDLQVFANIDAFNGHVAPEVMPKVMAWMSFFDLENKPFVGEVYTDNVELVSQVTAGMGAKFTFYDWKDAVGPESFVDMTRGD